MLSNKQIRDFQNTVEAYYKQNARTLPWRISRSDGTFDPYRILVSEVMLQQTQVSRVEPKFIKFLEKFPTVQTLAAADLSSMYTIWQGLGYNRRARFLREAARQIIQNYNGQIPQNIEELVKLPGVGENTAGAIVAYAHNQPTVFIETNIRSVYIRHFFNNVDVVSDKDIKIALSQTMDMDNPREFYWALMDYGTYVKSKLESNNHRSKHYVKQSKFEGSPRQIRGKILKELACGAVGYRALSRRISDERYEQVLSQLIAEKLICRTGSMLSIAL